MLFVFTSPNSKQIIFENLFPNLNPNSVTTLPGHGNRSRTILVIVSEAEL